MSDEYERRHRTQIDRATKDMAAYEQGLIDAAEKTRLEGVGSLQMSVINDRLKFQRELRTVEITGDGDPAELQAKIDEMKARENEKKIIDTTMAGISSLYHLWPYAPEFEGELYAKLHDTKVQQEIWVRGLKISRLQEISESFTVLLKVMHEEPARLRKVMEDTVRRSLGKTEYNPEKMDGETNELMLRCSKDFAKMDAAVPQLEERQKFYKEILDRKIHERDARLSEIPPTIAKLNEIGKELCALNKRVTPLIAKARKLYETTNWLTDYKDSSEFKAVQKVAEVLGKMEEKKQLFDTIVAGIRAIDPQTRTPDLPVSPEGIFLGLPMGQQTIVRKLIEATR